jgi:hypothetical protein
MKSFVFVMLTGVTIATVATVGIAQAMLPAWVWEESPGRQPFAISFSQRDAVEAVVARLSNSEAGRPLRRALRGRAKVEYHSPGHWTVRLDDATWTAHGRRGAQAGRYAEPDNAAARRVEALAGS